MAGRRWRTLTLKLSIIHYNIILPQQFGVSATFKCYAAEIINSAAKRVKQSSFLLHFTTIQPSNKYS